MSLMKQRSRCPTTTFKVWQLLLASQKTGYGGYLNQRTQTNQRGLKQMPKTVFMALLTPRSIAISNPPSTHCGPVTHTFTLKEKEKNKRVM